MSRNKVSQDALSNTLATLHYHYIHCPMFALALENVYSSNLVQLACPFGAARLSLEYDMIVPHFWELMEVLKTIRDAL